jgi:hypothetical protein
VAEDSILNSTKKLLGIEADYTAFDVDIIMHINSVFAVLNQLGVGPAEGFMIEDDSATWTTYCGTDLNKNILKTYMYMRVRILFDPPQTGFLLTSMQEQIHELEWRISIKREVDLAERPTLPDPWSPPLVTTPVDSHHIWWEER